MTQQGIDGLRLRGDYSNHYPNQPVQFSLKNMTIIVWKHS